MPGTQKTASGARVALEAVMAAAARLAPTGDATPTIAILAVALAGTASVAFGRRRRRRDR